MRWRFVWIGLLSLAVIAGVTHGLRDKVRRIHEAGEHPPATATDLAGQNVDDPLDEARPPPLLEPIDLKIHRKLSGVDVADW